MWAVSVQLYGFLYGTIGVSERADLTPVYEMIFRRLKELSLNWRYRFPELQLVDLCPEERDENERSELDKMRANLKQAHRQAVEDAKLEPVPEIVAAYENIYGDFPRGWPPWEFDLHDE